MIRYIFSLAVLLLLVFPGSALSDDYFPDYSGGLTINDMDPMMLAWNDNRSMQWEMGDMTAAGQEGPWYARTFVPAQHLTLKPMAGIRLGVRFIGLNGNRRALQYEYMPDDEVNTTFAGGFCLHYHPLPFMVDLDFNYKNEYDHDANARVGYSDMLRIDFRNMALFHNMDHMRLIAETPGNINNINPDKDFGVKIDENEMKIVLKSPGRPYHIYVNLREFEKSGTIQQRFDQNFFVDDTSSVPRDIDWITREITAGINGNILGLVELDYHHTIKTFNSTLRRMLVGLNTGFGVDLAHNLVPDFETNEDVISIHTDQSLPVTASGTFAWGDKVNKYSHAKVDFHREYGDISATPTDNLLIAVKYGHQKLVNTTPEFVTGPPIITTPSPASVELDSISTTRDKGVVAVSYHPLPSLGILAEYKLDAVDRENAKSFSAPEDLLVSKDSSITHTGKVSATYSPMRHTKVRASFAYSHNGDPSYNTDYATAYEGYVWGTWVPTPGLTINSRYKILRAKNPVRTEASNGEAVGTLGLDELKRSVDKDSAGMGVTWYALDGLVLGANYDYLRMKLVSHIIFEDTTTQKYLPYWDTTHGYSIFANYCFSFPLSLEANFSQTWSRSLFRHYDAALTADMDALTEQKIRETKGCIKADYEIWKGWGTCLQYTVSNFRDQANVDNPVTGKRDGTAHIGTALLTKKW